jgi:hypothetical protein
MVENSKLVAVEEEAVLVRRIFTRFAQTGSALKVARELNEGGLTTKKRPGNGTRSGGKPADRAPTELCPMFGWPCQRAPVLIAGGPAAFERSIEGAKDDAAAGVREGLALAQGPDDVVLAGGCLRRDALHPRCPGAGTACRRPCDRLRLQPRCAASGLVLQPSILC